eukprot:1431104-Rhodomonas_salina.1
MEWIIAPPGASQVLLFFESFDMEDGWDFVYVDSCVDVTCASSSPINGPRFSGTFLQNPLFVSDTGVMRIRLTSDGSFVRPGFQAIFGRAADCTETNQLLSGDRYGLIRRAPTTVGRCEWTIAGFEATQLDLRFLQTDPGAQAGVLSIEEISSSSCMPCPPN